MSEVESTNSKGDWTAVARRAAVDLGGALEHDGETSTEDLGLLDARVRRELLAFRVDGGDYAIPVDLVREIVRMKALTWVPRSPSWLLGVVALRGEVVEVVDLRERLGLEAAAPHRRQRIIVLHGDADRVTGLLVDVVKEVVRIPESEFFATGSHDLSCVSEMCPRGEGFISLLDLDRVLGEADV